MIRRGRGGGFLRVKITNLSFKFFLEFLQLVFMIFSQSGNLTFMVCFKFLLSLIKDLIQLKDLKQMKVISTFCFVLLRFSFIYIRPKVLVCRRSTVISKIYTTSLLFMEIFPSLVMWKYLDLHGTF